MQTEFGIRRNVLLVATAMLWPVVTHGAPQVPPSAPMTVVNTSANPVPVTGNVGVTGGVTVNNTSSSPVPVSVVSIVNPPGAPVVNCYLGLGTFTQGTPFVNPAGEGSSGIGLLTCPPGVTAIDVQRVLYDAWGGTSSFHSENVAQYQLMLGLVPTFPGSFDNAVLFPVLTNAAPQADLPAPIRLDKASGKAIVNQYACSSGVAGYNAKCGGRVYFIGTVVSN